MCLKSQLAKKLCDTYLDGIGCLWHVHPVRYSAGAVAEGADIADQDTRLGCYCVVGSIVDLDSLQKGAEGKVADI